MLTVSAACWNQGRETFLQFAAIPESVFIDGEVWRLFSAFLLHSDVRHFLSNALILGVFAYLLYGYFGPWIFPIACIVLGALVNLFSLLTYPPHTPLVGSSGIVYGMVGFWLTMFMLIERRLSVGRRLLHGFGVGLIVLVPSTLSPSVSYRSHLFGLVLGIALAVGYFSLRKEEIRERESYTSEPEPEEEPDFVAW